MVSLRLEEHFDLGLQCLLRPVCTNTQNVYGTIAVQLYDREVMAYFELGPCDYKEGDSIDPDIPAP